MVFGAIVSTADVYFNLRYCNCVNDFGGYRQIPHYIHSLVVVGPSRSA